MVKLRLTDKMSAWIAERVLAFPSEAESFRQHLVPFVMSFRALPLYVGWTDTIGIQSDGELICWSTEGEYEGFKSVDDEEPTVLLWCLVQGSERYRELQELLPKRPANAIDCPHLQNSFMVQKRLGCTQCGGLGWMPPIIPW